MSFLGRSEKNTLFIPLSLACLCLYILEFLSISALLFSPHLSSHFSYSLVLQREVALGNVRMKFAYGSVNRRCLPVHSPPHPRELILYHHDPPPPLRCVSLKMHCQLASERGERDFNMSLCYQGHVKAFEQFHSSSTLSHSVCSLADERELSHTFI